MKYDIVIHKRQKYAEIITSGNWPSTDISRIKDSIKKYKLMLKWAKDELNNKIEAPETNENNCSLCEKYLKYTNKGLDCGKCPIKLKTGKNFCKDTPYHEVIINLPVEHRENLIKSLKEEIRFLEYLLEDYE